MGEIQFLRAKPIFAAIHPKAHAGTIAVRSCGKTDSRLRIELMNYMTDIEIPLIVNHYSVITSPTVGG